MDWWNDFIDWTSSDTGWRVFSGAVIPFVAIIVAGIVAALIGRSATKRVVALQERESKNAAVAAIITAARKAATWGSLGHDERNYTDHLAEDADIRLRLLPTTGAPLAATWAQHEIADIKKNSSTFNFQADQSLAEFRDRLLEWQARPGRAKKLFKSDLERWKFESPDPDADLIKRQQNWSADQADSKRAPESTPTPATPTTTSLRAPQRTGGSPASAAQPASAVAGSTAPAAVGGTASASTPAAARADSSTTNGDANATTPISDGATRSYSEGVTQPYSDGVTRPYSGSSDGVTQPYSGSSDGVTRPYGDDQVAPVRPALGNPGSSTRDSSIPSWSSASSPASPASSGSTSGSTSASDSDNDDAVDDTVSPERLAELRDAREHNRANDLDAPRTDTTASAPTPPAEDAPAETDDATYTQPISANELRRRAEDDE
ncbi:hypothetical protein ITJ54_13190 [Curtobacterium sp. VKM Ac-2865]|uniref:hypothetical protein n=1 Tax=Curtobacterium sp. VKM Ac-2865 TaxID=2783817 RepID=UPI00188B2738|nr:hypothetical protein [Curtobacterium sp. VKM Ac-2865]MBF4583620.1 hypothetical protein [Curtobacterium sp. VKM Ac-2865]